MSSNILAAVRPLSTWGCRMVVSGGSMLADIIKADDGEIFRNMQTLLPGFLD